MDPDYVKTNREKRLTPKRGKFWCKSCDRQIVTEYRKCYVCRQRNGIKRYKK